MRLGEQRLAAAQQRLRLLWPLLLAAACDAAAVRQSPFGEYAPQINSWLDRQLAKQVADLSVPVAQLDASLGIHGPPASDLPPQRGDLANAEPPPRPRRRRRGRRRAPPAGGLVELWPNASAGVADAQPAAVAAGADAIDASAAVDAALVDAEQLQSVRVSSIRVENSNLGSSALRARRYVSQSQSISQYSVQVHVAAVVQRVQQLLLRGGGGGVRGPVQLKKQVDDVGRWASGSPWTWSWSTWKRWLGSPPGIRERPHVKRRKSSRSSRFMSASAAHRCCTDGDESVRPRGAARACASGRPTSRTRRTPSSRAPRR